MLVLAVTALVVVAPTATAAPSSAPRRPRPGACVGGDIAGRIDPRGRGAFTLNAQGLQRHQPIDVLLNTEAGATLLARLTSSASGKLCDEAIRLPDHFDIRNSTVTSGTITVPLHDDDALEEYQLSVIGEVHGDGFSLTLPVENDAVERPVQVGILNVSQVSDGTRCPALAPAGPSKARTALPLATDGRWIVDSAGHRVKLASVNWYGAEEADFIPGGLNCQSVAAIAKQIRDDGFNSVRLPWSNAMLEEDPRMCSASTSSTSRASRPGSWWRPTRRCGATTRSRSIKPSSPASPAKG